MHSNSFQMEALSKSFTLDTRYCESNQILNRYRSTIKGPSFTSTSAKSNSPTRFCAQAKDQFVVRVVKVTDKSPSRDLLNIPEMNVISNRPIDLSSMLVKDHNYCQNLLQQTSAKLFIGFQAQLPAMTMQSMARSTSADQVASCHVKSLAENPFLHKTAKGVRLCFSCSLNGNGLNIKDFYTGAVAKRLHVWEVSLGKPDLLADVLSALQKKTNQILLQIKLDGLQSIIPEVDYKFYPFTPDFIQYTKSSSRELSGSSENSDNRQQKINYQNTYCGPLTAKKSSPVSLTSPPSPHFLYRNPYKTIHSLTIPNGNRCQTEMLNSLPTSRPVSAYATLFGNNQTEYHGVHNFPTSASTMYDSTKSKFGNRTHEFSNHQSSNNSSICASNFNTYDFLQEVDDENYSVCSTSLYPKKEEEYHSLQSKSSKKMSPYQCTESSYLLNTQQISNGNTVANAMDVLINEVTNRLRQSPHLPLVVMPTNTMESMDETGQRKTSCYPLVFQLSSSNVVFVGLPATATDRPRIVTSPPDNPFIVSSSKIASASTESSTGNTLNSNREYTVATPRPGYALAIASDGSIYQLKNNFPNNR